VRQQTGSHTEEAFMSTVDDDNTGAVVAFVSGALIGIAATLLFVKAQQKRAMAAKANGDDYYYDGGDIFI
jgi:hypothetical protein